MQLTTITPQLQHCSLSVASLCTAKAVKAYFLNNTLPEDGLVCSPTEKLFPAANGLWEEDVADEEDKKLLEDIKKWGEGMEEWWSHSGGWSPAGRAGLRL